MQWHMRVRLRMMWWARLLQVLLLLLVMGIKLLLLLFRTLLGMSVQHAPCVAVFLAGLLVIDILGHTIAASTP